MKRITTLAWMMVGTIVCGYAQNGYNPLSVRPIHTSDVCYSKTVWRAMDLREKQNLPIYSRNHELTTQLMKAVQSGRIKAYTNDSLTQVLSWSTIQHALIVPSTNMATDTVDLYMQYGPDWRAQVPPLAYFTGRDLYQLEIKEEVIFDKQRSRLYYDIQTITVFLPADHPENIRGIQIPLASFSYKELIEKVWTDDPMNVWVSQQNTAANKSLADAFELRLFSSYIIKVSNGNDQYLSDIYKDQQKGIMASQWAAYELLETEHHLWEY